MDARVVLPDALRGIVTAMRADIIAAILAFEHIDEADYFHAATPGCSAHPSRRQPAAGSSG
jgi:hypothetical protein